MISKYSDRKFRIQTDSSGCAAFSSGFPGKTRNLILELVFGHDYFEGWRSWPTKTRRFIIRLCLTGLVKGFVKGILSNQ